MSALRAQSQSAWVLTPIPHANDFYEALGLIDVVNDEVVPVRVLAQAKPDEFRFTFTATVAGSPAGKSGAFQVSPAQAFAG